MIGLALLLIQRPLEKSVDTIVLALLLLEKHLERRRVR